MKLTHSNLRFEKVRRLTTILSLITDILLSYLTGKKDTIPDLIYIRLSELGGIYVKFLQVLVLKDGFMTKSSPYIHTVFDQVPFEDIDIHKILLGHNPGKISIDNIQPIAAGSFAQVYEASYDNKPVVLKILRPSVEKFIHFDHLMIRFVSLFVRKFSRYNAFPIDEVVKQFIKTTKEEINYKKEVDKAVHLYHKFEKHPTIIVPYTYPELCTKRLIVQERLYGVPFTNLVVEQPVIVRSKAFKDLLTELGTQSLLSTLSGDFVHADTHPGNLLLLEQGTKIGLIDFGITAEAPVNRSTFFNLVACYDQYYKGNFDFDAFFKSIFNFYAPDLFSAINTIDSINDTITMQKLTVYARQLYEERKNDADVVFYLNDARIRELFVNVINENNSFGLDITFDAGEMQVGAGTFNRMLESFSIKSEVMSRVYSNCVAHVRSNGLRGAATNTAPDAETIARTLDSWLSRIAVSNPLLFGKLLKLSRS